MSTIRNQVQIIGFVGQDPVIKSASNNTKYTKLSIATSERYKNKEGEWTTSTTWHNVTLFGQLAEIAEKYVTKGKEVGIIGKLANNAYTDKEGVRKTSIEIIANEMTLLGTASGKSEKVVAEVVSEDLPF
jgi:single-strand DNA-binding protein